MAAINFPASPTAGQTYSSGGRSWVWSSTATAWLATGTDPAGNYVTQSFTAQTSATVTHNFARYPVVNIIDGDGEVIIPQTIDHTSTSAFTVTFSTSATGTIIASAAGATTGNYVPIFTTLTETGSARTLSLTDAYKYIRLTHASGCAITVPAQADVAWLDDTEVAFRVAAAGLPTFPAVSGVTINNTDAASSFEQYSNFALKRVAENVWDLI